MAQHKDEVRQANAASLLYGLPAFGGPLDRTCARALFRGSCDRAHDQRITVTCPESTRLCAVAGSRALPRQAYTPSGTSQPCAVSSHAASGSVAVESVLPQRSETSTTTAAPAFAQLACVPIWRNVGDRDLAAGKRTFPQLRCTAPRCATASFCFHGIAAHTSSTFHCGGHERPASSPSTHTGPTRRGISSRSTRMPAMT